MVSPDENPGEIVYEELVVEEEPREVGEVGLEYKGGSVTEEEEEGGHTTDFQALLKNITPTVENKRLNELLKTAIVSRIFPDNFLDKYGVIVAMLVDEQNTSKPFDFLSVMSQTQDILSIGYEGRGIADRLEAFGGINDEELDKLSNSLGI